MAVWVNLRWVAPQDKSRTDFCGEKNLNLHAEEPPIGLIVIDHLQLMRSSKSLKTEIWKKVLFAENSNI